MSDEESTKWVRVSTDRLRRVTRRDLLKLTAAGAAGATLAGVERLTGPYIVHAQPRELRIMTWSHFVPAFDAWFDPFARAWGTSKNIRVTVDHVSFADIVPRATAEVAAQQGHDCYFFIAPPSQFEPQVLDLADINQEAERRYGPLVPFVRNSVYNPHTRKYFGFSDNWVPDPGDYLKSVWANVGYVNGPRTWDDLITAGQRIKQRHPEIQIPIGIGFSQDIDSNMATRAIMWSFGSSVQDRNSNVVLNSEETVKAVEYGVRLFREVMSPAVLSWNAASNNLALNARQTSYILNSISAYRSAQAQGLPVANDIFFTPALRGPARAQVATHVMGVWVIWRFSRAPDLAKEFLLHFLDNQRDAIMASRLYNFPSYWGSVADRDVPVAQKPEAGRRWIRSRVFQDPFGSLPPDKLKVLADSERWSTNVGFPGTANPAEGEIFDTYVITDMFAKAATGQLSPKAAVEEADRRVKEIFAKWRRAGLVGGGRDR
ncbi:MAG: extracellular solute-binding protein [Armatimonadota bacterium]|nr:extracellular solute-binding protein [Armatimonadota bacterium]MDR7422421.1 extracellular solute-binding protein [Armatimonadota bacterium]MDR7453945.1 extracellular solute-binding protein [Armatimonadota bacterium]MDR7457184.1 extracellular solute-binding protein [Armatimonadota bacterium]MDR7497634.1 extracellular solute-binding protein [Armatimonadota bacterium]